MKLGEGFEEALHRLEKGEDPHKIDKKWITFSLRRIPLLKSGSDKQKYCANPAMTKLYVTSSCS